MLRLLLLSTVIAVAAAGIASAEVITSTPEGGQWSDPPTWVGGVVPGADDDVIIAGPVEVAGIEECHAVHVLVVGTLFAETYLDALWAGGSIHNEGAIEGGPYAFDLRIGGDLSNDGSWISRETHFTGSENRSIAMLPGAVFESNLHLHDGAAGDILVETPLSILGNVDTGAGRMLLGVDCPLTMLQGGLSGEILAGGNEIRFESWSYLTQCTVDAGILVGLVQVTSLVTFTDYVTIMDTMQNLPSGGNAAITVYGDLINHGLIRNQNYGFTVNLHGDLTCTGDITCSQVVMDDLAERHLAMGPDGDLATTLFLPEFGNGTIIVDTPIQISGGISLGIEGEMFLEPGSSILITERGGIGGGTLYANGNEIRMEGTGAVSGIIDQGILAGQAQVVSNTSFTGGLTVLGTLQNWEWDDPTIIVDGTLINEGEIRDFYGRTLSIVARGDVENDGTMANSRVVLMGDTDQRVAAGAGGIGVPEFVLDSRLDAAGYQWFRDGTPIDGETLVELTFSTIGSDDYGTYHCEAIGGELSRTFVIAEGAAAAVSSPSPMTIALLEQNHPNPFRPMTEIAFHLPEAGHVRLAVYDVTGRELSVLVDREMEAGRHAVEWRPGELARGVFFYRLATDGGALMRKALRLE